MGFALLAYNLASDTASGVNTDLLAATDADFSQRSSHYIFTEPYKLLAVLTDGASLSRGRVQVPTWNAIGEFTLFNVATALQPNANLQFDEYLDYPPLIPTMEEFQVQLSNTGAGGAIENAAIIIATTDFTQNVPGGRMMMPVRFSFTVTPTLNAWSGPQSITLAQSLRGGVYAVVGATLQGANAAWFRMIFPRYRQYHGRKLRPGFVVQHGVGDAIGLQLDNFPMTFGEWGRFHTFELPQVEVFGVLAGSITYQGFMWIVYLGEDTSLLNQGLGGGM